MGFDIEARSLSVIHLNVRSHRGELDELKIRLRDSKTIDVSTLSETWLQPNISHDEIQIPGYTSVRYDRSAKSGGGVFIYCKNGLSFVERNDLKGNNESVWVQINRSKCKPLIIGCVYKPPDQPIENFVDDFNLSLSGIEQNFDKIILGDLVNIDFTKNVNSPHRKKLKRIADLNDLSQLIKLPTRITETSQSLIDLIFTNVQHRIKEQEVIPIGLSDHLLIYCVFKGGVVRTSPKVFEFRSFKTYNKDAFAKDLINVPWHVNFNNPENVNDCVYVWNKLFTDVMNEVAPIKTRRTSRPPMPWMTPEIAKLISDWEYI